MWILLFVLILVISFAVYRIYGGGFKRGDIAYYKGQPVQIDIPKLKDGNVGIIINGEKAETDASNLSKESPVEIEAAKQKDFEIRTIKAELVAITKEREEKAAQYKPKIDALERKLVEDSLALDQLKVANPDDINSIKSADLTISKDRVDLAELKKLANSDDVMYIRKSMKAQTRLDQIF